MQITKKQLVEWSEANTTIRHRDEYYKLRHEGLTSFGTPNGRQVRTKHYFLMPADFDGVPRVGSSISIYHKGRGIYGLTINRTN